MGSCMCERDEAALAKFNERAAVPRKIKAMTVVLNLASAHWTIEQWYCKCGKQIEFITKRSHS